jgi:thiosulfate reductase cytochrome b subunit
MMHHRRSLHRVAIGLVLASSSVLAAPSAPAASSAPAGIATGPNLMHPLFVPLDAAGAPAARSGRLVSSVRTCGVCHDAEAINASNDHWNSRVQAECVSCHVHGGRLPVEPAAYEPDGRLRREALRISPPRDEHCAACHGLVHAGTEPLRIPDDFGAAGPARTDALTLHTGVVISGQNLSESFLNLNDKEERDYPWDAHARRLVGCVACHYAANNPLKVEAQRQRPGYLVEDPRRLTLAEFLRRPDHRLAAAQCISCHAPLEVHDFLPYRERHLASVECEACHVPRLFGPAARMIDSTVVTPAGAPALILRGVAPRSGETLNTAYTTGYAPMLARRVGPDGKPRLGAVNAIEAWSWRAADTGAAVPWEIVRGAYLDGEGYAAPVLDVFDTDGDRVLAPAELRLDRPEKTELIRRRLAAAGVSAPEVVQTVEVHPVRHGVLSREQVSRDCSDCHAAESSRLSAGLDLAPFVPGGAAGVGMGGDAAAAIDARVVTTGSAGRIEPESPRGLYVFGHARGGWADRLGFALFAAVALGTLVHGGTRFVTRAGRSRAHGRSERVYMYTAYERIWHWLMAASVLVLMITGLQVHFAGERALLPLPLAVAAHNLFAVILTVNGFLSLFYHLATSAIRQFVPHPRGLLGRIVEQARFYTSGIFLGRPHPSPKTPERKLNPLQQITYLSLLNILFPLQLVTGGLIWAVSSQPALAAKIGGLTVVAPLHNLGAWAFLAFFALHLYLTTTGHTVFSNLRAMLDGYDEIDPGYAATKGGSHD